MSAWPSWIGSPQKTIIAGSGVAHGSKGLALVLPGALLEAQCQGMLADTADFHHTNHGLKADCGPEVGSGGERADQNDELWTACKQTSTKIENENSVRVCMCHVRVRVAKFYRKIIS